MPPPSDQFTLRRRTWTVGLSRPEQRLPEGDWRTCLIMGGRGSGKTRAGAEGAADLVHTSWGLEGDAAIVAPTFGAARDVCVEGPSGLLRTLAGVIDKWNRSQGQLHLADGTTIFCDGADDGALRIQGLNLKWVWCDEAGLWRITQTRMLDTDRILIPAWDESIQPALRLPPSKAIVTGTPKGRRGPLIKRLIDDPTVPVTRMRTRDNYVNLSPAVVDQLEALYGGTSLGAQELEGHLVDAVEGALWEQELIDQHRLPTTPGNMTRIVVAVDPPGGATEAGIIAAGIIQQGCPCGQQARGQAHAAVIADYSTRGTPDGWGQAAVDAYTHTSADRIVAEVNYGGDMVEKIIRSINPSIPYSTVRATRGKAVRAEPIAALYEQGRVHHIGHLSDLEGELTTWTPDAGWSPNRLDALVWAVTELGLERAAATKIRSAELTLPGRFR